MRPKLILVHSIFKRIALLPDHHGDLSGETAVISGDGAKGLLGEAVPVTFGLVVILNGAASASPVLVFQKFPNKLNNFNVVILHANMALLEP
jgi:hypothetical protein